ncbi:cytochrome c5 [Legionella quinlivanii]|uniref:Cytochrome c5 n=1 Tax=Legionella quinlivanii TaxID=45073 RepID=A0A0W0Y4P1_9GAMM|nr:c-type cytochrome [Legionella quinlivanii]KTD51696.1 cytochrome c5 [Legionella quinlivanii]MCW8451033.1 c-type cytochrome [Legionella quinlivanii]SEF63341.1 Cytochrome C oxidase, cbb3-type, subunit III [Legionella quinlivanii DSM 21216]STY10777.1 Cytochrome c5 [Legionella quinlivanii]
MYFRMIIISWILSQNVWSASHRPQEFLQEIRGSSNEGEQIVEHFCATCHAAKPMINLGAPVIQQDEDWSLRVKQGFNLLFKHTEEGYGAMPSRGGCFECSDEQLKLAILAMLSLQIKKNLQNELEAHKKNN